MTKGKNAIQETLYLNSFPGMAESLIRGKNTPLEDCLSEDEVSVAIEDARSHSNLHGKKKQSELF